MGYPVHPQPSMATTGQPHMNPMGLSNCHVVNGVPAPSNFQPMRMNSANELVFVNSFCFMLTLFTYLLVLSFDSFVVISEVWGWTVMQLM